MTRIVALGPLLGLALFFVTPVGVRERHVMWLLDFVFATKAHIKKYEKHERLLIRARVLLCRVNCSNVLIYILSIIAF